MIVQLIIELIVGVLGFIVGLLPVEPAPPDIAGGISSFVTAANSGGLGIINQWVPISELLMAVAGLLLFMVAIHLFRLVGWLLALFHVGGAEA